MSHVLAKSSFILGSVQGFEICLYNACSIGINLQSYNYDGLDLIRVLLDGLNEAYEFYIQYEQM